MELLNYSRPYASKTAGAGVRRFPESTVAGAGAKRWRGDDLKVRKERSWNKFDDMGRQQQCKGVESIRRVSTISCGYV